MEMTLENGKLNVSLEGRIDASNASVKEAEIFEKIGENSLCEIELDCKKLEYISSAGLRIILKLLKVCQNVTAINVNSEVYDILEMTGFTEMLKVTKAYREISVDGCEVIGVGANGKVYRIDEETIVKTYLNPESIENIKRERELARTALVLGVPTAISYDVVKVGTGYGSIFELLNAKSFAKLFATEDGHFDEYMDLYVGLLKTIHSKKSKHPMLCDAKQRFIENMQQIKGVLGDNRYAKLEKMVNEIPEEDTLLHGDYHIKNVMMQKDEVLLIDMDTLSHGNILFEFTGMFNAYIGYNMRTEEETYFLGITNAQCLKIYNAFIESYFTNKTPEEIQVIKNKIAVTALSNMLSFAIWDPDFFGHEKGIEIYRSALEKAIDKVDNLIL